MHAIKTKFIILKSLVSKLKVVEDSLEEIRKIFQCFTTYLPRLIIFTSIGCLIRKSSHYQMLQLNVLKETYHSCIAL
jgi:hypothetical protein